MIGHKYINRLFVRIFALTVAIFFIFQTLGCVVNPATGERSFTLLSAEDEIRIGKEEHPKLVSAFGGLYEDIKIQSYVSSIGHLLHSTSEMSNIPFRFVVLDTSIVNAFALPGGYIHVSRGLIALANDEAELAGVLAHEIGHVTARHPAQRQSRGFLAGLTTGVLGAIIGSQPITEIGNIFADAYVQSYSRDQEFEADNLGVRYLARAGYDPFAMSSFLSAMSEEHSLQATIFNKKNPNDEFGLFSSHPRTIHRINRAAEAASKIYQHARSRDREQFLRKIDGIIWGPSKSEGFIENLNFYHPKLGFKFTAPSGFTLKKFSRTISGFNKNGASMKFDGHRLTDRSITTSEYIKKIWLPKINLKNMEYLDIDSIEAVTATGLIKVKGGYSNSRFVVIRWGDNYVYRFIFTNPPGKPSLMDSKFKESALSFRRISVEEAKQFAPLRIRIIKVKYGDTYEELSMRMQVNKYKKEWFNVLNRLNPDSTIVPGQLVKIIMH